MTSCSDPGAHAVSLGDRRPATAGSHGWRLLLPLLVLMLVLVLCSGCSSLLPKPAPLPSVYLLDGASGAVAANAAPPGAATAGATTATPAAPAPAASAPTLLVSAPRASSGLDSRRILYQREPHRLDHFAHSDWADTPARMLAPLIVAALEQSGSFHAVVVTAGTTEAGLRLDTEILRLQQQFDSTPSQVRFTLRAHLVDSKSRRVLAWREFDSRMAAPSDDPRGGVTAANTAVQSVLQQLADFCAQASRAAALPTAGQAR